MFEFPEKTIERSAVELNKEDFVSDQMVKWCPGCGAHSILSSVANVFPKIGYKKENSHQNFQKRVGWKNTICK